MQGYYEGYRSKGEAEQAKVVYFGKEEPNGICLEPAARWSFTDHVIELFPAGANGIEETMAQNWPLGVSNWSLGNYSSLEEQCSTGRSYL